MSTVTGPVSSTDTAVARWNGTTGSVIQDSAVTIDGSGNVSGVISLTGSVTTTTQSQGDDSTNIATTAYVDTGLSGLSLGSLSDVVVTPRDSIYLGAGDGVSDTFGQNNVSLGVGALGSVINAENDIAIGALALSSASGGTNNIAVGWSALSSATAGQDNIAIGTLALGSFTGIHTGGESNIAVGPESLDSFTTGINNIAIGRNTGATLVTGDNNILIGVNADVPTSTTSNYININGVITGDSSALNIAGSPTTTTQSAGDNSDNIATTSYVDNAVYTTDVPVSAVSVMSSTPLPSCTYDNGPDSDGVGATLTATSNGALIIDGMSFSGGERVGIQDEAAVETNGIYDVSSPGDPSDPWVLTRSADFDDPSIISSELPFCVLGGNTYTGSVWCLSSPVGTIGTDPIILSQMSYSTPFTLGNSLTSAHIFVGNAAGVATDVGMTGDISVNNAGVTSIKTNVALAGSPTTTTQSAHDNSTKIATTAYVDAAVSAGAAHATTFQYLTSGSGATYTTPANCKAILVQVWGPGGGGGASVTNNGSSGGDTIFNGVHAAGGSGGANGNSAGPNNGGNGGTGGTGTATMRWPGGAGGGRASNASGVGNYGGYGGGTSLSGSVGSAGIGGTAQAGSANTGCGGQGGTGATGSIGGCGGGAGEFIEIYIPSPSATYTYTIGAGGSGGAAGTHAGGNGGSGFIKVTEYY